MSWEARQGSRRGTVSGKGGQASDGGRGCCGVRGCLEMKLFVFDPERDRGALKAPPVSLSVPTGVFEAGTLNSHARRRGSPEFVMGSLNVTAAIWSISNSSESRSFFALF